MSPEHFEREPRSEREREQIQLRGPDRAAERLDVVGDAIDGEVGRDRRRRVRRRAGAVDRLERGLEAFRRLEEVGRKRLRRRTVHLGRGVAEAPLVEQDDVRAFGEAPEQVEVGRDRRHDGGRDPRPAHEEDQRRPCRRGGAQPVEHQVERARAGRIGRYREPDPFRRPRTTIERFQRERLDTECRCPGRRLCGRQRRHHCAHRHRDRRHRRGNGRHHTHVLLYARAGGEEGSHGPRRLQADWGVDSGVVRG